MPATQQTLSGWREANPPTMPHYAWRPSVPRMYWAPKLQESEITVWIHRVDPPPAHRWEGREGRYFTGLFSHWAEPTIETLSGDPYIIDWLRAEISPGETVKVTASYQNEMPFHSFECYATQTVEGEVIQVLEPERRSCARCERHYLLNESNFYLRKNGSWSSWCRRCNRERTASKRRVKKFGRRFGVEIEFNMPDEYGEHMDTDYVADQLRELTGIPIESPGYTHEVMDSWKLVTDSSVEDGLELVSPPLTWDRRGEIRTLCHALASLGADTDRQCGLHVHHEVADLSVKAFHRMFRGWREFQPHTNKLVAQHRVGGEWSSDVPEWCVSLLENTTRHSQLRNQCDGFGRYLSMNLQAYPMYGTVEVRLHEGTLDGDKIVAWIDYGRAIIEHCIQGHEMLSNESTETVLSALPMADPHSCGTLRRRMEHATSW